MAIQDKLSGHRSIPPPQMFGAGVSVGVFAGILIGSLVTLWLGDAAVEMAHRLIDRLSGRGDEPHFELLLQ